MSFASMRYRRLVALVGPAVNMLSVLENRKTGTQPATPFTSGNWAPKVPTGPVQNFRPETAMSPSLVSYGVKASQFTSPAAVSSTWVLLDSLSCQPMTRTRRFRVFESITRTILPSAGMTTLTRDEDAVCATPLIEV